MMPVTKHDIIVIGGSAGSIPVVSAILDGLSPSLNVPVIIVLHRQRNVNSEMTRIFQSKSRKIKVTEPEDKEPVLPGHIYLAPQNYHLLVEQEKCFSLDYSEQVHFSRPSIDVTFESIANVYGSKTLGILLSGANKDGTNGVEYILQHKGKVLVQDPATAEYPAMVRFAIEKCSEVIVYSPDELVQYIANVSTNNA